MAKQIDEVQSQTRMLADQLHESRDPTSDDGAEAEESL